MNASQFPLTFAAASAVETLQPRSREDLVGLLLSQLRSLYDDVRDIRRASLGELWRMARDLVSAIEEWSQLLFNLPGAEKMELALDIAWTWLEGRGGLPALRDKVADAIPFLPAFIGRRLLNWILNADNARGLMRFVLELAVKELKELRSGS